MSKAKVVDCKDDHGVSIGYLVFIPKHTRILACAVWPDGVHHGQKEFAREGDAVEWLKRKAVKP